METHLKINHLAPYLPYGLKYIDKDSGKITIMRTIVAEINLIDLGWGNAHELNEFKPILRPLSDLTKEIEHNKEKFVPSQYLSININWYNLEQWKSNHKLMNVEEYNNLLSWHFDVFGLIEKGLAIDINTLCVNK